MTSGVREDGKSKGQAVEKPDWHALGLGPTWSSDPASAPVFRSWVHGLRVARVRIHGGHRKASVDFPNKRDALDYAAFWERIGYGARVSETERRGELTACCACGAVTWPVPGNVMACLCVEPVVDEHRGSDGRWSDTDEDGP